jgi:uncharacterized RDD family membrane protein YckC
MSSSCPQCGWAPVDAARCPRCGVEVARYRANLAAVSTVPAPPVERAPPPSAPAAPPVAAPPPAGTPRPAGFWVRAAAVLIDVVLVMVAEVLFGFALWAVPDDRLAYAASRAFRFLASPCYFVFLHWARGQTLGKMVFRVRVVTLAGGPLPFGISVLRHLGSWISAAILGVGYLVAAFRSDKRALHDLIAGTRVEHVT